MSLSPPPPARPRGRRRTAAVALVATGAVALAGVPAATASPSGPLPAEPTAGAAVAELAPVAEPAAYPGTAPGTASVELSGDAVTLSNAVLSATWSFAGGTPALTALHHAETGTDAAPGAAGFVTLTLADGTTITGDDLTAVGTPVRTDLAPEPDAVRWSEREAGAAVSATYRFDDGTRAFDLVWTVSLRDGASSVQQAFELTNVTGTFDVTALRLVDVSLPGARVDGRDDGSPVVVGDQGAERFFLGVETPLSKPAVSGDAVQVDVPRAGDLTTGDTLGYTASVGVVPDGQLRRGFQYYVERERVHDRRTFLHYQSWLDLKPPSEVIDSAELDEAIALFGDELTGRGARIDSFWIDDGWDYVRDPAVADESDLHVWDFDPTEFPDGFAPQKALAEQYDASLSVWMSPFGGYGQSAWSRQQLNASKPEAERLETHGGAFALGGERYYERFRSVAFDMVDNQGVRGFKFDGIGGGLYQTGPDETYLGDYEAMLQLMTDLREHQPEVWINATVGTWGSPYWLWFTDSIWRDGHDAGQAGAGSVRERYVSYRDSQTYRNTVVENPLFPVPSLMNHGFTFSERTPQFTADYDLSDPAVRAEVGRDMRAYFALGLGLQELYVRNTQVRPDQPGAEWFWDELAANARWARDNENLLSDVHWVGGDPAVGEVYGTAAWAAADDAAGTTDQAMLMLRNPTPYPQSFRVEVGDALELPAGTEQTYAFTDRDGNRDGFVARAGTDYWIELEPFEVTVFEGVPSDAEPTPSEPGAVPLDKSAWTATADSAETTYENGAAANAIDGNAGTIWHTSYATGIDPLPHTLTIDLGSEQRVGVLRHVSRQDGGVNGRISTYEVRTSLDGESWTTVASGTFNGTSAPDLVDLEPTTARFVQLRATGSVNGAGYASVAEIDLFGAPEETEAPVTVTAQTRCLAGTAYVAVRAVNDDDAPLAVRLVTAFGTHEAAEVAPGASAYQSFSTRSAHVDAGEVTVEAGGGTVVAPYDARTC